MSVSEFLDSNILVYSVVTTDPRQVRASALLQERCTISVQILNEFANVLSRKLKWPWPDIAETLAAVKALCAPPVQITTEIHERAVALCSANGFAFYDALIVAAALQARCTVLLSEDMQDGRVVEGRLTIRNPFR